MEAFDLTHIAFILFLAFLGGLFLQRLKQPALVGYIIVGAIIGPGLLGIQGDDFTIKWLAELAVVLLMFMLGIELDIRKFRAAMKPALWTAGLQVVFGIAVMLGLSVFLGWSIPTAILFGFVIALSSTAVAVAILHELRTEDGEAGRIATAVLIAQDILVVPMLLVISAMSGGGVDATDILRLGISLTVIAVSLWGIFQLSKHPEWVTRIERLFTAGTNQPVVAALALCFGAAALSGALGLSTAYGAFALGLLLGNLSGGISDSYKGAMHSIHDLLMMIFFLSVGLMLDLSFVFDNLFQIAILLAVTIFLKTVVNVAILRFAGVSKKDALTLGAVLGQIGEFSFVLIALGLSNGFVSHETYQLALAVIALSLVISPLWLQFVRMRMHRYGVFFERTSSVEA